MTKEGFEAEGYSKFMISETQEDFDACNDEILEMFYGDDTDEYDVVEDYAMSE